MSQQHDPDLKYWLGFNRVKGVGPAKLRAMLDYFGGSVADAWFATERQLSEIGVDRRATRHLLQARKDLNLDEALQQVLAAAPGGV